MRSHYCGAIGTELLGQRVTLCGWADSRRDLGGVVFINLRDRRGIVQCVIEPDQAAAIAVAHGVRLEYCVKLSGEVRARPDHQVNDNMATGAVEIVVDECEILNASAPLPFMLDESASEELRLRYRYIDLRRPHMQHAMRLRAALNRSLRAYLDERGFAEFETPILTRATPEGARDYLVPSRNHQGEFFALPQSPQLFKQLLMMSGMDRYYQIARCFRDEDLRADRQPEFTQLDIELSFIEREDVLQLAEGMIVETFKNVLDVALPTPFPRMPYSEAMRRFGSDKPDLRNPLELIDIAEQVKSMAFKVFSGPANDPSCRVVGLRAPGGATAFSRKQIDELAEYAGKHGAKGLAWVKVNAIADGASGLQGPVAKFFDDETAKAVISAVGAKDGDLLLFGAGPAKTVSDFMGALRLKLGKDLGLVAAETWAPMWVIDFPLVEWDKGDGRYFAVNHPFTAPTEDDIDAIKADPAAALSKGYDMVLNGHEIGGGSIRIHNPDMQRAAFDILGIAPDEAENKFGFLLEALRYGCPPHGGIAFGIDRIAALMAGTDSIRDVIAFPKTTQANCLLTGAPSAIDAHQLDALSIAVVKDEQA